MDRFVSNYTLRLDAKGRVSIPAPFRGVLVRDGFEGLYCYPTLDQAAIDAGGNALLSDIESLIARYPPYSNEREEFLVALYGTSETLKVDSEGRVVLSDELKTHASINDAVTFVGLGSSASTATKPQSQAALIWSRAPAAGLRWWRTGFRRSRQLSRPVRPTAWSLISACRRCSSTRRSEASRSGWTERSTCAWRRLVRAPPMSSRAPPSATSPW
jgi:MraZ protein